MLALWRRAGFGFGSSLTIGDGIVVRVLAVDRFTGRVRLGIEAPPAVPILRDGLSPEKVDAYCQRASQAGVAADA